MKRENTISDYIIGNELNVEKIIKDYKRYIECIIENSPKLILSYEDKEEIISDVFFTIWHNKEKIDKDKPLKNYIAGITKNLLKNKLKKNNYKINETDILNDDIIDLNTIDIISEEEQMIDIIKEELKLLNKEDYNIFVKYYFMTKSIKEISKELNLSVSNVKVRLHRIRKKLKLTMQKRGYIYKILSIILVFCMVTGVVFAKDIVNFIKSIFVNTSEGVERAVQNGYIDNIEMDYSESNEAEVKIDSILMDDYNLDIIFNIRIKEVLGNIKITRFDIPNLVITDEENNIIVAKFENKETYEQFCKERNIKIEYKNIAYSDGSESSSIIEKNDNTYKYSYITHSTEFPKSKQLIIKFDKILVGNNQSTIKKINGKWNIIIDLPEEFYNRKTEIYNMKECNIEDLILTNAKVSKTNTKIALKTRWGEPVNVYNENDDETTKQNKLMAYYDNFLQNIAPIIYDEYIENSKGQKFYSARSSDGDGRISKRLDGILIYEQTFNLTSFDLTDELTLVLHTDGELLKRLGKEKIIVKLVRK